MSSPSPEQIADIILSRRQVYGLDADTRIREAANRLTAHALFEILGRLDDRAADLASQLSELAATCGGKELSCLIGWHEGDIPGTDENPEAIQRPEQPKEIYLRLRFRNEEAAYYQFHLFPDVNADYILGASRKRTGAVQHLRLELSRPETLQTFVESCRSNSHFVSVEESTAEEFERAPSNAI